MPGFTWQRLLLARTGGALPLEAMYVDQTGHVARHAAPRRSSESHQDLLRLACSGASLVQASARRYFRLNLGRVDARCQVQRDGSHDTVISASPTFLACSPFQTWWLPGALSRCTAACDLAATGLQMWFAWVTGRAHLRALSLHHSLCTQTT